jgi:hypothetical protein
LELTPEERERIFEEEKIRAEARTQIEDKQKGQLLQAQRAVRRLAMKIIVFGCIGLALLAVVAWRVRLTLANNELEHFHI